MSNLFCGLVSKLGYNPSFCKGNSSEAEGGKTVAAAPDDPEARSFLEGLLFGVETPGAVGCNHDTTGMPDAGACNNDIAIPDMALLSETWEKMFDWPQILPHVRAANFLNNNENQVLVMMDTYDRPQSYIELYLFNYHGAVIPGWPIKINGTLWSYEFAVGDINSDGKKDILFPVGSEAPLSQTAKIMAIDSSGSFINGWNAPSVSTKGGSISVALSDYNGDGKDEVVVTTQENIYLFQHDGQLMPNWPRTHNAPYPGNRKPVLVDLDKDGKPEIVYGDGDNLTARKSDGSLLPGFPITVKDGVEGILAGDVNRDGISEILIYDGHGFIQGNLGNVNIYDNKGSLIKEFPALTGSYSRITALGNLDADADLEILVENRYESIAAYNSDGTLLAGWPIQITDPYYHFSGQIITNLYNGKNEVITSLAAPSLYNHAPNPNVVLGVYNSNGLLIDKRGSQGYFAYYTPSAPIVADLKGNGDAEFVLTVDLDFNLQGDEGIFSWNTGRPFSMKSQPWPMEGHDLKNTYCYETPFEQ